MEYNEKVAFKDVELFQLCLHSKFGEQHPHHSDIKVLPKLKIEVFELLSEHNVEMRAYRKGIKDSSSFTLSEKLFVEDSLGVKGCCEGDFVESLTDTLNSFLSQKKRIPDYITLKYIQKKLDISFLVLYEDIEDVLHKILKDKEGQLGFESCRSLFINLLSGITYPTFLKWNALERYFLHWQSKNFSYDYFTFLEVIFALEMDDVLKIDAIDIDGINIPYFNPQNTYRYQLKDDYFFYVNSGMIIKLSNIEEPIIQFEDKNSRAYCFLKEFSLKVSKGEGLSFEEISREVYKRKGEYKQKKERDSIVGLLKHLRASIQKNAPLLEEKQIFPTKKDIVTCFYE